MEKDFVNDLREFMDEVEVQTLGINNQQSDTGYKIESRDQANFFVRKIMEARAELEEIELTAKKELENKTSIINAWKEKVSTPLKNQIEYFSTLLEDFAKEELAEGKKKSLKLPYGTIAFKKQKPLYEYADEEAIKTFLQSTHPDLIETITETKYNKTTLKSKCTVIDGKAYIGEDMVPGITVTEREDVFEVK